MRLENIPREAWIGLGILLLLATQNASFIGIFMLVGLLLLARSAAEREDSSRRRRTRSRPPTRQPSRQVERPAERPVERRSARSLEAEIIPHVEDGDYVTEAIATAGHDPAGLKVLPVDMGLLVYKDDRQPEIYHTQPIPNDVDYVRPFVELRLPVTVTGRVRFELLDGSGERLFVDEHPYELRKGTTPIIAGTWLPIHDARDLDGMWQLKVWADDVLLANHVFAWDNTPSPATIREHIQEDGEISPQLRQALAENRLQKMSLDELLAHQDEDEDTSADSGNSARRAGRR